MPPGVGTWPGSTQGERGRGTELQWMGVVTSDTQSMKQARSPLCVRLMLPHNMASTLLLAVHCVAWL